MCTCGFDNSLSIDFEGFFGLGELANIGFPINCVNSSFNYSVPLRK